MIKAIETHYKGYRFRSRLEARWAVFFDTLGITWEYEKEGFRLGQAGRYLPDFWLPQVSMWTEVKPASLSADEIAKCAALAQGTNRECLLLVGMPTDRAYHAIAWAGDGDGWPSEYNGIPDGYALFSYCFTMHHGYPYYERRFYGSPGCNCAEAYADGCAQCQFADVADAVVAARSARFEYSERRP